jgi:hypothetical protein
MKHIKRLLPFLVLVFIVSSCGNSTSKDPVEASIQLLNETDDLAEASPGVKKEAIQKLKQKRAKNQEVIERIEDTIEKETNSSTKKTLKFRKDRLLKLNTDMNKRIVALEGAKVSQALQEVGGEPETDTSSVTAQIVVASDSVSTSEPDSMQLILASENDSLNSQEIEETVSGSEDSTLVAEATEPEPAEETPEEDESVAEASDEVDRGKLLNDVVPEGVAWFWIKVAGIIVGLVVLVLLGMHFIPKIMSKIQSGGFSWPSFSMGGVGTFFSGMFSGFSGVANRRRRRILIGSLLGLLLLIGIGFALYQYGDDAITAMSGMFTSDPDDRRVADHRDKKERQKITPAPYPPGYDKDGNPIEVSDSTETEEIEEIETEEEVEEEKKKGSGSGGRGKDADKKLKKEIERLKKKLLAEKKAREKLERERKSGTTPIKPKDTEKPRPKRKDSGFTRGGSGVATGPTKIPKQYGIGSNKDLSASRGGSR